MFVIETHATINRYAPSVRSRSDISIPPVGHRTDQNPFAVELLSIVADIQQAVLDSPTEGRVQQSDRQLRE